MRMTDIIAKKRDGYALSGEEIAFWIAGVCSNDIPDYQSAALLMAICLRGMNPAETAELTLAMTHSGDVVDLSSIAGTKLDKHSTGGVGDTTTLIVAPVVAACGVPVAKMSGRGLAHTGGTLDKLESIAGVQVERSIDEMIAMLRKNGLAVIGQSQTLVPADRALYALRDVSGTVESIPLIASSIMSKKIAAGADAIVLDVKTGSGAFMETPEQAFALARQMVEIGRHVGRETVAIITDMNQPLGMKIGNQLEVQEAIEALSGKLPQDDPLIEVSALLGAKMLQLGGAAKDEAAAKDMFMQALFDGSGKEKLRALLSSLGGDGDVVDRPESLCSHVKTRVEIRAKHAGVLASIDAMEVGVCAMLLGAGRSVKTDRIDPETGLIMKLRTGDRVEPGQALATLFVNDDSRLEEAAGRLEAALRIEDNPGQRPPMIYGVVEGDATKGNETVDESIRRDLAARK